MKSFTHLYRSIDSGKLIDIFLLSAIASILALRLFLHLSNYPQIGNGQFHIAHMLWGGLLMMAALMVSFLYHGRRLQTLVALVGGIGFGVFIDELGKFITRDHNYFFQPTIGILYALFAILYIAATFLTRKRPLTTEERHVNALQLLEESIDHNFDINERNQIREILVKADQTHPLTMALTKIIDTLPYNPPKSNPKWRAFSLESLRIKYRLYATKRSSERTIRVIFGLLFVVMILLVWFLIDTSYDFTDTSSYEILDKDFFVNGQIISTLFAEICLLIGIFVIIRNRLKAFVWLYRSLMVNLLLTQFFLFARIEFNAMPFFIINLVLMIVTRFIISQETILSEKKSFYKKHDNV